MESCPLLPADWNLPPVLRIRLGHRPGCQRVIDADGHLLLVLHEVPKQHEHNRVGQFFWRQPDGDWLTSIPGAGGQGLDQHLKTYSDKILKLTEELEAARGSAACFKLLGELSPLARSTRNLYTSLKEARKNCEADSQLLDWRDTAYDLTRQVELLQNDAKMALDYEVARQAEAQAASSHQMATSAHRLNVLAAFFFPIVTLASVLGANLENALPGWQSANRFQVLMAILITGSLLGAGLTYLVTRPSPRPSHDKK